MKVLHRPICRTGESPCDSNGGNDIAEAHGERTNKLHQLSLVTPLVAVNLSDKPKPVTSLEETVGSTAGATRGRMVLRVGQRMRMNVGGPNGVWFCTRNELLKEKRTHKKYRTAATTAEGIGDAHSSEDTRKGKTGRSEGALL